MQGLATLLVVGCLVLVWYSFIRFFISVGSEPVRADKEPTKKQSERTQLKAMLKLRNLRAEIMKWYLNNPKYKDNYKLLLRKELEVAQMLKGLKRRTISDIKYEKITEAAKSGKLNQDILDMIS